MSYRNHLVNIRLNSAAYSTSPVRPQWKLATPVLRLPLRSLHCVPTAPATYVFITTLLQIMLQHSVHINVKKLLFKNNFICIKLLVIKVQATRYKIRFQPLPPLKPTTQKVLFYSITVMESDTVFKNFYFPPVQNNSCGLPTRIQTQNLNRSLHQLLPQQYSNIGKEFSSPTGDRVLITLIYLSISFSHHPTHSLFPKDTNTENLSITVLIDDIAISISTRPHSTQREIFSKSY